MREGRSRKSGINAWKRPSLSDAVNQERGPTVGHERSNGQHTPGKPILEISTKPLLKVLAALRR